MMTWKRVLRVDRRDRRDPGLSYSLACEYRHAAIRSDGRRCWCDDRDVWEVGAPAGVWGDKCLQVRI